MHSRNIITRLQGTNAYFEKATQLQFSDSEMTDSVAAAGSSIESINICQSLARAECLQKRMGVRRATSPDFDGRDAQNIGTLGFVLDFSTRTYYPG